MKQVAGEMLWQWREQARAQAIEAGIDVIEVDWLLRAWTSLDALQLRLGLFSNKLVSLELTFDELQVQWQRRLSDRIPVQYLTGIAPWRDFNLVVSPAVLIPRPETECLIDLAVQMVAHQPSLAQGQWVDLGTGSGAIALGLARALPTAAIHAVDYSRDALQIAQTNADRHHLSDRITWHHGSWFAPLASLQGQIRAVVSNPPYIPTDLIATLQPEVTYHEPHLALDGGPDGLGAVQHLIKQAPDYLESGGWWLVELMAGQAEVVADLLEVDGHYQDITIHPDWAGIPRFVSAYRN